MLYIYKVAEQIGSRKSSGQTEKEILQRKITSLKMGLSMKYVFIFSLRRGANITRIYRSFNTKNTDLKKKPTTNDRT